MSLFPLTLATDTWGTLATHLRTVCVRVLRYGRVPRHVAFVMDGNRRYAEKYGMRAVVGHGKGYEAMEE
ncbi:hypothetical protein HDU93_007537, partial [Gonapodya sp. JEL0774]